MFRPTLLAVALALGISALAGAAEPTGRVFRSWTSKDGRTIQAELLDYSATEVRVKLAANFQVVKIPLENLSEENRKEVLAMVQERSLDTSLSKGSYADQIKGAFTQAVSKQGLKYQIFGNPKWDSKQRYPLVIWLHGAGQSGNENGNDNTSQMGGATPVFSNAENQGARPCFILAPQCPDRAIGFKGVVADNLMALIADLSSNLPIDRTRIYLTGSSMGGVGTWTLITQWPDVFACAVPLCGIGDEKKVDVIKGLPIWMFHGDKDDAVPVDKSRTIFAALKAAGSTTVQYTELPGEGHLITSVVYAKKELHEWMFQQKKGGASAVAK